jgi:N-acylneuraminate cytidylyltransferase
MSSICIIPARGGSQRIKDKNIKEFHGKPIIAYSIEAAKDSGLFSEIIVTSDSSEVLAIAEEFGATAMKRDDYLSQDEIGTQEVATSVICTFEPNTIDKVCVIYPCSPMLNKFDLINAMNVLASKPANYAFSVGTRPLSDAGNFYFGTAHAFRMRKELFDIHTIMIPMSPGRVCDINTPEDWSRAEKMYEALHATD